jgi:hypothetical protein
MFSKKWVDKRNVLRVYDEIELSNKNEEPPNHYYKWKKQDTKEHVIGFHLPEISRRGKPLEIKYQ